MHLRMPDLLCDYENLKEQVKYKRKVGNYRELLLDEWLDYELHERKSGFTYELLEQQAHVLLVRKVCISGPFLDKTL
ncbi:MAG: hypothetical protein PHU24_07145 [Sphaerochaetaceae bacterium]|jgi:hypothetical protein|nr:hypothetical protein [Sphaerochaetaceae bacterium]MDD2406210.1 hypothetical protein [Sphaerochaetaceae bacterium]MDD3671858.1 hypothetical protein [Sphaerochaetaceae bacterium]MDD4258684.1 hypothetical protein [Sphaerochaetaceae bacterium]MDD4762592.1 hypothetical protein [Sphaerochaetaceae bacterium]